MSDLRSPKPIDTGIVCATTFKQQPCSPGALVPFFKMIGVQPPFRVTLLCVGCNRTVSYLFKDGLCFRCTHLLGESS